MYQVNNWNGMNAELYQSNIKIDVLSMSVISAQVTLINACNKRLISNKSIFIVHIYHMHKAGT